MRPLANVRELMAMLTLSILGSAMGDREFWRCVIEPRYGMPPPLSAHTPEIQATCSQPGKPESQ